MTSIPAFHVSGKSRALGKGKVLIESRKDAVSSGTFIISIDVQFNPASDEYPVGKLTIKADLSDSAKGTFISSNIELINSFGKHNPTLCFTGRCKGDTESRSRGFRYWVMVADNRSKEQGTMDVVSFVIHDRTGNRVAYGTGPLVSGDIKVEPS